MVVGYDRQGGGNAGKMFRDPGQQALEGIGQTERQTTASHSAMRGQWPAQKEAVRAGARGSEPVRRGDLE